MTQIKVEEVLWEKKYECFLSVSNKKELGRCLKTFSKDIVLDDTKIFCMKVFKMVSSISFEKYLMENFCKEKIMMKTMLVLISYHCLYNLWNSIFKSLNNEEEIKETEKVFKKIRESFKTMKPTLDKKFVQLVENSLVFDYYMKPKKKPLFFYREDEKQNNKFVENKITIGMTDFVYDGYNFYLNPVERKVRDILLYVCSIEKFFEDQYVKSLSS